MTDRTKFKVAFNIGKTNEERIEAYEMYKQAFNAKKISESVTPGFGDIHIIMEIGGINVLLAPGAKTEKNNRKSHVLRI